jgi:hypothetical protein
MRVITPSNAAMSPDSLGANSQVIASYEFEGVANADQVVPAFNIGTIPATGPYILSVYVICTASTAPTGGIAVTLTYDTVGFITASCGLTSVTSAGDFLIEGVDDPNITLDWVISGWTTDSANYRIVASVVKLF